MFTQAYFEGVRLCWDLHWRRLAGETDSPSAVADQNELEKITKEIDPRLQPVLRNIDSQLREHEREAAVASPTG